MKRGDNVYYQVWLDTNQFEQDDKLTKLGIKDTFSEHFTLSDVNAIKVYDKQTGSDVTEYFTISVTDNTLDVHVNDNGKANGIVDTNKVVFGRYYVIDILGKVSDNAPANTDIENVAEQYVSFDDCEGDTHEGNTPNNPESPENNGNASSENPENPENDGHSEDGKACKVTTKKTQKRVNKVKDPEFNPHKFVVNGTGVDITGNSLLDDDSELADRYTDTASNPYVDKDDNNESSNLNTKTVKRGDVLTYQLWLDTTEYIASDLVQSLALEDTFDSKQLVPLEVASITVKDATDGRDVSEFFDIAIVDGVLHVTVNDKAKKTMTVEGKELSVIDTEVLPFGRYYKVDFSLTVSDEAVSGSDIVNVAKQIVVDREDKQVVKTTETRVNKVEEPTPEKPTPEKPETPESPLKPETPESPLKPLLPSTGDSTQIWWLKVIGWLSVLSGVGLFVWTKFKGQHNGK